MDIVKSSSLQNVEGRWDADLARLTPRSWSWNPLVWLAALSYRLTVGERTVPIWVIFARAPGLLLAHLLLVASAEYLTGLNLRLRTLARVYGSRVNGCRFCDDLEADLALRRGVLSREELDALASYQSSDRFTASEKAALAWVEEINTRRAASAVTFATLREHYSERDIVRLTWLNAVGNYLNLQAKPLGLAAEVHCVLPG